MGKERFSPDFYGDESQERSFQRVQDAFSPTGTISDGVLLENVAVGITATTITTSLGRPWLGYVVCGQDAAATVFANMTSRDRLILTASAAITCNIWVF